MFIGTKKALLKRPAIIQTSYSSEATTLFAAMSVQPNSTRKTVIDNLIVALKNHGLWSKFDIFYVLAAHDSQAARLNWKTPASFALTTSGTITFTTDRGYAGDGSTGYLDTGWNPNTNGVGYTLSACHMAAWNRTNQTEGSPIIGAASTIDNLYIYPKSTDNNAYCRINTNFWDISGAIAGSPVGHFCAVRTVSNSSDLYLNGTFIDNDNQPTNAMPNSNVRICGGIRTPAYGTWQVASASMGDLLSGSDITNYYNDLQTYMTAVGA